MNPIHVLAMTLPTAKTVFPNVNVPFMTVSAVKDTDGRYYTWPPIKTQKDIEEVYTTFLRMGIEIDAVVMLMEDYRDYFLNQKLVCVVDKDETLPSLPTKFFIVL